MSRDYVFSPEAEDDLAGILKHIASDNRDAAIRVRGEFQEQVEQIVSYPKMGRSREELSPGIRSTVFYTYIIFYREEDEQVQFVRVLPGARDITPELFSSVISLL